MLREAHQAFRAAHDVPGQLRIDNLQGVFYLSRTMLDSAEGCFLRVARATHRMPGQRRTEATALSNLGNLYTQRKQYTAAARYARQALALN